MLRHRLFSLLFAAVLALAVAAPAEAGHGPRAGAPALDFAMLWATLEQAKRLQRLHALIVARDGKTVVQRAFRGPGLDVPVNVKSVSKTVIAALTGAAIARGVLRGTDQPIAEILADRMPRGGDPRLKRITVGHLLSMRAGLARTSGRNYGRWVASRDWVRAALARPFVEEPGGDMLYSTGSSHLLSAILTRAAGRSTLRLARDWLAGPLGITVPPWQRDPQGIYFGGNNMRLSPRALFRLGELYRRGGVLDGKRVLPKDWVRRSWTPRGTSPWSGDGYGYGWFITEACGQRIYYARGFGGQFIYVVPGLKMTVVITSSTAKRTRVGGYRGALEQLVGNGLIAAAMIADGHPIDAARGGCVP